jgi:hypothetical protein
MSENDKLRDALANLMNRIDSDLELGHEWAVVEREMAREALAASKPEPQAQAAEPEVMAGGPPVVERIAFYLLSGDLFSPELADHEKVRDLLIDCCEAIAKKDAALLACVEALKSASVENHEPYEQWKQIRDAAIQQAEEARK